MTPCLQHIHTKWWLIAHQTLLLWWSCRDGQEWREEKGKTTGKVIEREWKHPSFFSFLAYCTLSCFRHCARPFTSVIDSPYLTVLSASSSYLHITYKFGASGSQWSCDSHGLTLIDMEDRPGCGPAHLAPKPLSLALQCGWLAWPSWAPIPSWDGPLRLWLSSKLRLLRPLLHEAGGWQARWDPERPLPDSPTPAS